MTLVEEGEQDGSKADSIDSPDGAQEKPRRKKVRLVLSDPGRVLIWSREDYIILRTIYRIPGLLIGTLPFAAQQNVFLGLPAQLTREEVYVLLKEDAAVLVDGKLAYETPPKDVVKAWEEENSHVGAGFIKIQGDSGRLPWYKAEHQDQTGLVHQFEAIDMLEQARFAIYYDLWTRGYYLGGGLRFGGHFLVYPGDTLRYHSHFVATVFPRRKKANDEMTGQASFSSMDIVAWGRLGTAVKKSHLVCGWDEVEAKSTYFTIEWAGFG